MKNHLAVALLLLVTMAVAAVAEDFSVTLRTAGRWPGGDVYEPGQQLYNAPAGSLTAVWFKSRGRVRGTNSCPMKVWAVPSGDYRRIIRIDGYCHNPAEGGWNVCPPAPKPCPSPSLLCVSVESALPSQGVKVTYIPGKDNPMPYLGERQLYPAQSMNTGSEQAREVWPEIGVGIQTNSTRETGPQTCDPGGHPPDPPDPSATGAKSGGAKSGAREVTSQAGGHQPPPQPSHGTAGMPWDPSPSHPHVADPVH